MKALLLILSLCISVSSQGNLGIYDAYYAKSDWSWCERGSYLYLKHNSIKDCYISVNTEPWGYTENNWTLEKVFKKFSSANYCISRVEHNGRLWCYTYISVDTTAMEQFNVYSADSCKTCLKAAEKIILKREKK